VAKAQLHTYRTYARKETHPGRLAALARLSGIDAPCAMRCSLLEIGCGDGGNIIPLAAAYPESRFLGFDISGELIEKGQETIRALELQNVELVVGDIGTFQPTAGGFDYVICHGVYSWVAPELQRRILEIGKPAISEHGVFFVSYNTLPGWRQRGMVRDILQVGSRLREDSDDSSRYASAMELASRLTSESSLLPPYVREAVERLSSSEPSYVIQEFLGEYNAPVLFMDFMRAAESCGLQFMSEARVVMMSAEDLGPDMRAYLDSFGSNVTMREQVLDLLRNRTFRETILCHAERSVNRGLSTKVFKDLVFIANYLPIGEESGDRVKFRERATDRELLAPKGECEQVLAALASMGARGATISELLERTAASLALSEHDTLRVLVTLWRTGFCDAVTAPLCGASDDAMVNPFSVAQALGAGKVTSFLHESHSLTPLERMAIGIAAQPLSFDALKIQLLQHASKDEADSVVERLREKGFFL
jgi:hypothetical protein